MLTIKTKGDLQQIVDEKLSESLTLDYKASPALGRDDKKRDEICKDVSAFANSAGGQIIYGIEEKNQKPVRVDEGVEPTTITREWLEQVINSRVQPRIERLVITPIPFEPTRVGYVLTIPQASARAPHQAPDNKYYRRYNFQSVPMADYEVRDAMRRATTPELFIRISLPRGDNASIEFAHGSEISKPVILSVFLGNRSVQPAFHTIVQLGIDARIQILSNGEFTPVGQRAEGGHASQNWLTRSLSIPPELPVFKEAELALSQKSLALGFHSQLLQSVHRFTITTLVQTPGYTATEHWVILQEGALLTFTEP
jgi:hypothetical protein